MEEEVRAQRAAATQHEKKAVKKIRLINEQWQNEYEKWRCRSTKTK